MYVRLFSVHVFVPQSYPQWHYCSTLTIFCIPDSFWYCRCPYQWNLNSMGQHCNDWLTDSLRAMLFLTQQGYVKAKYVYIPISNPGYDYSIQGNLLENAHKLLTLWGRMMHICFSELGHHWIRQWLVAFSAPSHYLNQWWYNFNETIRNIFE